MHYSLVFDVAEAGYRYWWLPSIGIGLAIAFSLCASLKKILPISQKKILLLRLGSAFCLLWSIILFISTYSDYAHMRNSLMAGNYKILEGTIMDFVPQAEGDHEPESFRINGHHLSYSFSTITAGFNQTRTHNGPIHEGQKARLAVVGDEIARVEIVK